MRFFKPLLVLAALLGSVAGRSRPSSDTFGNLYAKQVSTSAPRRVSDSNYRSLTAGPRNHSVVLLLTALEPRFGCKMCRGFQSEWDILVRSWVKGDKEGHSGLVFGTLDFADGRDTFASLSLQTAPVILFYPPTDGQHAVFTKEPLRFDFGNGAFTADHVHTWLSRNLPGRPHPKVRRPFNWTALATSVAGLLGFVTLLRAVWPWVVPVFQSRKLWCGGAIMAMILFTSGTMFNTIRGVPYIAGNGHGGIQWIAPGFQTQFGLESQIVAAIYASLALCFIYLAEHVPRVTNPQRQAYSVLGISLLILVTYSFLLSIFRMKNPGYPFSLPPFM